MHRFSTTVEKERPLLNKETKLLIALCRLDPTGENLRYELKRTTDLDGTFVPVKAMDAETIGTGKSVQLIDASPDRPPDRAFYRVEVLIAGTSLTQESTSTANVENCIRAYNATRATYLFISYLSRSSIRRIPAFVPSVRRPSLHVERSCLSVSVVVTRHPSATRTCPLNGESELFTRITATRPSAKRCSLSVTDGESSSTSNFLGRTLA